MHLTLGQGGHNGSVAMPPDCSLARAVRWLAEWSHEDSAMYFDSSKNSEQTPDIELLDRKAVARLLGISTRTLDRYHRAGSGPPRILIGRTARYRANTIVDWLRTQEGKLAELKYM